MKLSQTQIIAQVLESEDIQNQELFDELYDHLNCVSENDFIPDNGSSDSEFVSFLKKEINAIAPQGIQLLELQINYVSQSKSILIMKKFMYILGLFGTILFASGVLFKIMHWPGANTMLLVGQISLFLICVPFFCVSRLKSQALSPIEKWTARIGLIASITVSISILFKLLHLMGANVVFVLGMAVLIFGYVPLQFLSLYRKNTKTPTKVA